jgi:ribosomal protein RSM22 (predicted rRNA methylase)
MIPQILQKAIEELTSKIKLKQLADFAAELSKNYRSSKRDRSTPYMEKEEHRLAYLAMRFPATYAAIRNVTHQLKTRIPEISIESLLDLGAGPGTGMWALSELFPALRKITLLEQDPSLIVLGKKLAAKAEILTIREANWEKSDLQRECAFEPHDLILMSYSLGEVPEAIWPQLLEAVWKNAQKIVIIIEPGTPIGFERILKVREKLLSLGAFLIAPCPHQKECPLTGRDWCHFSERVARSQTHRFVKSAELGHEDEKFSYVIVGKSSASLPFSRILRHPNKHSGHISLTLCTSEGVKNKIISRKDEDLYRKAKKAEWGSEL